MAGRGTPVTCAVRPQYGAAAIVRVGALLCLLFVTFAGTASRSRAASEPLGPDAMLCRQQTDLIGQRSGMPPNLLTAVSFVESGRWDSGTHQKVAWPWTVMAEGKGRVLPSKQAAIAEVKRLQMRGVRNIDVGCMQINLYYHSSAFASLEEAFDPATNVGYAVDFLENLYRETGSWLNAAVRYHSATPEYANRYRIKIAAEWNELNALNPAGRAASQQLATLPQALGRDKPLRRLGTADIPLSAGANEKTMQHQQQQANARAESERQRAEARSFAENWRAQKLAEYARIRQDKEAAAASGAGRAGSTGRAVPVASAPVSPASASPASVTPATPAPAAASPGPEQAWKDRPGMIGTLPEALRH